jgi:type I restriction enzyme R subunit
MATGTGKTLTAAAVIKLFLRTGNASRILFLVDRLELED